MAGQETLSLIEGLSLSEEELVPILKQGAVLRLPYLESRLVQAERYVQSFEEKYATTLDVLRAQGLPDNAGYEMHEDFIEWEYWNDSLDKMRAAVKQVRAMLEKMGEPVAVY
jgi:hypothetical protein